MILGFNDYQRSKLNESGSYSIPGIKDSWGEGYVISVLDATDGQEQPRDRIIVPKKNEKSIALCYVNNDGDQSEYVWIPVDACSTKKSKEDKITEIHLDPYKKWITASQNKSKIEDFIEDFANHIETSKTSGQERIKQNAQDDVELLMDLIGIPGSIESFESCGDYIWDANLDNGMLIEITKRSKEDLLSKFKIYLNSRDHHPCVYINNDSLNKKTSFKIPDMNVITVPKGFTEIKNPDPYIKYLTRRSMDIHNTSDQESLFKHFQNMISSGSEDKEALRNIVSLLSEFMDKRDVEEASGSINQE
jgi:hypothetical protein